MAYPARPILEPLPQFRGTIVTRPTAEQRAVLLKYVVAEYQAGRSLRQIAELTGRTQSAVRRALDQAGVERRPRGANRLSADDEREPGSRGPRLTRRG